MMWWGQEVLPRYRSPRQRKHAQKSAIYRHQNRQQSVPQVLPCKDLTHSNKTLSRTTFHARRRAGRIHHWPPRPFPAVQEMPPAMGFPQLVEK